VSCDDERRARLVVRHGPWLSGVEHETGFQVEHDLRFMLYVVLGQLGLFFVRQYQEARASTPRGSLENEISLRAYTLQYAVIVQASVRCVGWFHTLALMQLCDSSPPWSLTLEALAAHATPAPTHLTARHAPCFGRRVQPTLVSPHLARALSSKFKIWVTSVGDAISLPRDLSFACAAPIMRCAARRFPMTSG
jgi:hypothetical protein